MGQRSVRRRHPFKLLTACVATSLADRAATCLINGGVTSPTDEAATLLADREAIAPVDPGVWSAPGTPEDNRPSPPRLAAVSAQPPPRHHHLERGNCSGSQGLSVDTSARPNYCNRLAALPGGCTTICFHAPPSLPVPQHSNNNPTTRGCLLPNPSSGYSSSNWLAHRPGPGRALAARPGPGYRSQTPNISNWLNPPPPGHGSDQSRYPTPATSTLRDRIMAGLAPRGCPGHGHSQSALVCASLSHRPSLRPARLGQGPPPGRRRARLGLGSTRTKRPILSGKIASAMGEGLTGVG